MSERHPSPRVRAVRHRIANTVLPPLPPPSLGDVQLLPHQRRAAVRLLQTLSRHHGALLADAVGLGKTYSALAVAQRYRRVHVLAPAALVEMWQAAVLRTRQAHVHVQSLHVASRRALPDFAADTAAQDDRPLVIIDEAHALRNPRTVRYNHVAAAVNGCDVLLLSATPMHNGTHDLQALFALFRGTRDDTLRSDVLGTLIVRRPADRVEGTLHAPAKLPSIRRHRAFTVPQDRATLDRLLALPAPLPTRDGAAAGALVRMGLLRAWCSSDAALAEAITRRLQRGTALRDALRAGRLLSAGELRAWIVGEDDGSMQLGFAELLSNDTAVSTDTMHAMLATVTTHCDALRALREHHATHARADEVRAAYLRRVAERHPDVPVVAFSQHGRTIRALFRALSDIAGVGMLTSRQARVASGSVTRPELLAWFAPRAQGRPPPPPQLRLRLLLATDLIAEGVNLQDAAVVVHLDLPWTHAVRTQRTGRVVRLGSPHRHVHEYRVRASPAARRVLRLEARVARKGALSAVMVGRSSVATPPSLERATLSAPDARTMWMDRLERWRDAATNVPDIARATVHGAHVDGAIVLVRWGTMHHVLAMVAYGQGWWLSERADALLTLSHGRRPRRCPHGTEQATATNLDATTVRRLVARWARRVHVRRLAGASTESSWYSATHWVAHPAAPSQPRVAAGHRSEARSAPRQLSDAQRQALRRLHRALTSWSAVQRARCDRAIAEARRCIEASGSASAEPALLAWLARSGATPELWLRGWREYPALVTATMAASASPSWAGLGANATAAPLHARSAPRVVACLFVRRGTAETRATPNAVASI